MTADLEEGAACVCHRPLERDGSRRSLRLDWSKVAKCVDSVVPVCVQDATTRQVENLVESTSIRICT